MRNLLILLVPGVMLLQNAVVSASGKTGNMDMSKVVQSASVPNSSNRQVVSLNETSFIERVFDFRSNTEWKFKGDRPTIVDFYAVWCGPCKKLAPILVQLQEEYGDKIQIYKVDAEKNRDLAAAFGVTAYPTLLFIPMEGQPGGARGLLPKEELERIIETFLKVTK